MGLIKTGIMVGGGAYAANRLAKTWENTHQQQPQQQPAPAPMQQRALSGHASFCNGSCGGQCMPQTSTDRYLHASYCNGGCGGQCYPAGQSAPPYSGSARTLESSSSASLPWDREKANVYASGSHPAYQQ